jgi:hypothetical protein
MIRHIPKVIVILIVIKVLTTVDVLLLRYVEVLLTKTFSLHTIGYLDRISVVLLFFWLMSSIAQRHEFVVALGILKVYGVISMKTLLVTLRP